MAADNDGERAYKQSRRAEAALNLDTYFDKELEQLELEEQEEAAAEPAATPSAPAAAPAPQDPAAVADPAEDPSMVADVAKGIGRSVPAFAADVVDNAGFLSNDIAEYLGLPEFAVYGMKAGQQIPFGSPTNSASAPMARDAVDQNLGTPETKVGQFAQDAAGEMIALVPVLRGLRSVSMLRAGAGIFAADFAVTAAGSNKTDQTLSGQLADFAGADNWFVDLIKNNPDDSTAERMIRTGLEGAFIGKAFDKAVDGFKWLHGWNKGRRVRTTLVNNADEGVDEVLEEAASTVAAARGELQTLQATKEMLDEADTAAKQIPTEATPAATATKGPKVASPEEAAAFKGEAAPAPQAAPAPTKLPKELAGAKPRYSYGEKQFDLEFESDIDRAAYIAAQKTPSKRDADYVRFVRESTGMDEAAIRAHGAKVKEHIKSQAKDAPAGKLGVSADAVPRPNPAAARLPGKATALRTAIDAKIVQVEQAVATAEQGLAEAASSSPARGEVLENIRQELGKAPGGNPKELDRVLGKAADERLGAAGGGGAGAPPPGGPPGGTPGAADGAAPNGNVPPVRPAARVPFAANHLELTPEDVASFRQKVAEGDYEGAAEAMANSFDPTNIARMNEAPRIQDIVAGFGHEFGEHAKSLWTIYRSQGTTEQLADGELRRLASEHGMNGEKIAQVLREQIPNMDLDVVLTSYRMFELSLVKKSVHITDMLASRPDDLILQDDFAQIAILAANVRDARVGLQSSVARATAAGRIRASAPGLDQLIDAGQKLRRDLNPLLDASRNALADERAARIAANGGSENIKRLAEAVRMAKDDEAAFRILNHAVKTHTNTIGDINYAYVATNLLSSFTTHTTNVIGPLAKVMMWDPAYGIGGGALNFLTGGGREMLQRELHFAMAKWRNLTAVLPFDAAIRRASPLRSSIRANIRRAVREGRRVTVPDGNGKFLEIGEGNALRAYEAAQTLKAGLPFHKPLSGFSADGAKYWKFGGRRMAKLGEALEAQATGDLPLFGKATGDPAKDISRLYGGAAKAIDYIGRVQSWPRHMIAGGDELVAGISYQAKLEADAFSLGRQQGLKGKALADYADDITKNASNWKNIASTVDKDDVGQLGRLQQLSELDKSAGDYVKEATFTQKPGKSTDLLLKAQRMMPALRFFTFFARTGANIARVAYNTSIVGSGQQLGSALLKGNREEASMAAAKVALNTAIIFKTYELMQEGRLTGSGPINKAERDVWLKTHEPYSIWIEGAGENGKGAWVSYARLDPFATQIQLMAEISDTLSYMDDSELESFAGEFFARAGRLIGSKTYFQGISDFLSMVGGETKPVDIGLNLAKDFVPQSALLRNIRRAGVLGAGADPARPLLDEGKGWEMNDAGELVPRREGMVARWGTELGSKVQAGVPGPAQEEFADLLNQVLDLKLDRRQYPQRDIFGEIMSYPPAFGPENFSGIVQSEKGKDPVVDELLAQDISFDIKARLGDCFGVELSPEQQDFMHRAFAKPKGGLPIREYLEKIINTEAYKNAGSFVPGAEAKARRKSIIEKRLVKRVKAAAIATREHFPAVKAKLIEIEKTKDLMQTQEGSEKVRAEIDARKSSLMRALEE